MRAAIPRTLQSEFSDWVIYMMVEAGLMEPQLGAVIAMSPTVDAERLRRASRLVMDAEPILGCRFVKDDKRPIWERVENLDEYPGFSTSETDRPVHDGMAWLSEALSPTDGPQMRTLLCLGEFETVLALKFSHVALDGGAMKEAIYRIAEIYEELSGNPDYEPEPNLGSHRSILPARKSASLAQKVKALRPDSPFPPTEWGMPGRNGDRGGTDTRYVTRHVGRDAFRPIREWGRARGATVNDMLLAAYYQTLLEVLDPDQGKHTPIQMSCDYRKWLPEGTETALGNISGIWCISDSVDRAMDFEETVDSVAKSTREWKAGGAGVEAALGIALAGKLSYSTVAERVLKQTDQYSGESGYPVLTNIGVLDPDRLTFGPTVPIADAFALGPISHPPGFTLCVSSYREEMTLSSGFDGGKLEVATAERVLDGVVNRLESVRSRN